MDEAASSIRSEGEKERRKARRGKRKRKRKGSGEDGAEWKIEVRAGGERSGGIYIYIVGIGNVASSLVVAAGPEGMLREGMGCQATYVHP